MHVDAGVQEEGDGPETCHTPGMPSYRMPAARVPAPMPASVASSKRADVLPRRPSSFARGHGQEAEDARDAGGRRGAFEDARAAQQRRGSS